MEGRHTNGNDNGNGQRCNDAETAAVLGTTTAGNTGIHVPDDETTTDTTDTSGVSNSSNTSTINSNSITNNNNEAGLTQLIAQVPHSIRTLPAAGLIDLAGAFLQAQEAVGIAESRTRVSIPLQLPVRDTAQQQLDAHFSPATLAALAATAPAQNNQNNNMNMNSLTQLNPASLHDQLAILLLRKNLREARRIQQSHTDTDPDGHATIATATHILDQMQRLQERVQLQEQLQHQLQQQQQHQPVFPPFAAESSLSLSSSHIHNVLPPKVASVVMGIMNDRNSRRPTGGGTSIWAALQQPVPVPLPLPQRLQEESTASHLARAAGTKRTDLREEDTPVQEPSASEMTNVTQMPASVSSHSLTASSLSSSSSSTSVSSVTNGRNSAAKRQRVSAEPLPLED